MITKAEIGTNGEGRSPLGSAVRFHLQARSLAFSIQSAQATVPLLELL